jgi:hemerythrin superfamily protein
MTGPIAHEPQRTDPPPRRGQELLLSDHHHRLEAKCREMLGWAFTDDARELVTSWSELEAELLDHLSAEEEVILPGYTLHAPEDARRILEDHATIRSLVTPLAVEVELHEIRLARLQRLVELLEAHSAHEDRWMYPWATHHVELAGQRLLYVRIGRWLMRARPDEILDGAR